MIDHDKIREFWIRRGEREGNIAFESLANLEEDERLLGLKIRLEKERLLPLLNLSADSDVLDLGAGNGQWALRFAPMSRSVTAVDYSPTMLAIGRRKAMETGCGNIEFIESPIETFVPAKRYATVFVSGLFIYLDNSRASRVAGMMAKALADDGVALVRDGTSIKKDRHVIDDRFSPLLRCNYSAVYRTSEEYGRIFKAASLSVLDEGDMFDEGCPLNKYPETRLRYYLLGKAGI